MKFLILATYFLMTLYTFGQKHKIGVYSGVNANGETYRPVAWPEFKLLIKPHFGVNYQFHFCEKFILSSQIGIIDKGFKYENVLSLPDSAGNISITPISISSVSIMRYLNTRVMVGYKYVTNDKSYSYLSIGLAPDILLAVKQRTVQNGVEYSSTNDTGKKLDINGIFKIGYNIALSSKINLDLCGQFAASLTPYIKKEFIVESFRPYHYSGQLTVGLQYSL
ncbi:MAG: hypothetical protein AB8B72_08150 [Crocinitomicaceae bacterium]